MKNDSQKYLKPLSVRSLSSRIWNRKDNIYKMEVIQKIVIMYFEECEKALENGEKVGLSGIGSLNPHVHSPRTYSLERMNSEDGNKPYTSVKFIRGSANKLKMNINYQKNIKNGFAGLGEKCECNQFQKNILIEKGFLKSDSAGKEDCE